VGLSPPKGVIWDLGNVLIQWDPFHAIAAGVGAEEAERFLTAVDFDFYEWNRGPDSGQSWEEAEEAVRRSHPHWLEHALSYRRHFERSLRGEVPGTADLVRRLREAGVPMWGLTNWSHELYPHAPRNYPLLGLLEDVLVSGTEKVAKPDPAIFELAVARTGIAAEDLVFVDDSQKNVAAAIESGLDGIWFTGAEDLRVQLRERGLPV